MIKKFLMMITIVSLVIGSQAVVEASPKKEIFHIPKTGIVKEIHYQMDRTSPENVRVKMTKGIPVISDLIIKNDTLEGNIKVKREGRSELYVLESKEKVTKDNGVLFTGKIKNHDLFFEAYVNNNLTTINIYGLDQNNRRIDPITISLNGESAKTITNSENQSLSFSTLDNSDFDFFGGVYKNGISMEIQGYNNRTQDTPWIVRLWTDESDAIDASEYPASTITHVHIYKAFVENSGPNYSTFESVSPDDDSATYFKVPFKVRGETIQIPVRVSSTDVQDPGFSNPQSVEYFWFLKDADTYEDGNDDEGILTQHEFSFNEDTPRNSYGYIEVDVSSWIQYELVGNNREYITFSADYEVWYD